MSSSFPNGTTFSIYTAEAAAVPISAISNANPGVATSTAHGFSNLDILLLTMPGRLDDRIARVSGTAANTFNIENINTTSTTLYPSGFGVGSAYEWSTPVALSQTVDVQSSGGEQQFYQWVYLEDGRQRQRPTFKNARSLQLTLDYDPSLSWHTALMNADENGEPYPFRAALPNGSFIFWSMYVGFDGEPAFTINENQKVNATFSLASPFSTRYAS